MLYRYVTLLGLELIVGTWKPECGHTWILPSDDKIYALRSMEEGSSLVVYNSDGTCAGEFTTPGKHSCHITIVKANTSSCALLADYTSGTLSVFALDEDGIPKGEPVVRAFTDNSHIHSSWVSPSDGKVIVVDLGADCLYRFDSEVLVSNAAAASFETVKLPAGSGPRHCAFNAAGDRLYVSTEKSDEVLVFDYPGMSLKQSLLFNPVNPHGGSHIALSPDGKFVYVSARLANDGIAIFKVGADGTLSKAGYMPCGTHPRHFAISKDGKKMAVACRDSNTLELFDINTVDGSLTPCGKLDISKPVYCNFK